MKGNANIKTSIMLRRRLARLKQAIQGKKKIHFLHIGKTGGSAVKHALQSCPAGLYQISIHSHSVTLRKIPKGEGVVFFLRNPISRFVSGFYSRQRQGQPNYFYPWSPGEKSAFAFFKTPEQLATAIASSNKEERKQAHEAMQCIGHIKTSYWDWFEDEHYFLSRLSDIFFVGRQESLDDDFKRLRVKLKLPESLKLSDNDIVAHRNPVGLDKTLSREAVENLERWYAGDFKFVSLCETLFKRC